MSEAGSSRTELSIALFGVVNAGKSSLVNALTRSDRLAVGAVGGTTRSVATIPWREVATESGRSFSVVLIDTPGLEEIDGAEPAREAIEAAKAADLVLFIAAEDLTDSAFTALAGLRSLGKPMIVALNKIDLLDPVDLEDVIAGVEKRLRSAFEDVPVVPVAAAPVVREKTVEPDGRTRWTVRRDEPRIAALESALLSSLLESASDLVDLNDAAKSVSALVESREALKADRRRSAERAADETSLALAFAMAANPIPLLDFLTGPGGLVILVHRVAGAYGESPRREEARALAKELLRGGRKVFWGSVLGVFAGGAMKILPGLGHLAGAATQGASAGYVAHVLGRALVDYHENGHDWGEGGLIADLERIAARTDRKALTRGLVDRIKARLGA